VFGLTEVSEVHTKYNIDIVYLIIKNERIHHHEQYHNKFERNQLCAHTLFDDCTFDVAMVQVVSGAGGTMKGSVTEPPQK
jgi:hypothetical protein